MSYKIKLFNKISKNGLAHFGEGYECAESIENPDAVLVRSADMHKAELDPSVVCIARAGAGVNNIPIERCSAAGIVVFNTPGANANAVRELALGALVLSCRKIADGILWARTLAEKGSEVPALVEKGKTSFVGPELKGKSLGIIGLGAIGSDIASVATALGMTVYGYDPYITVASAWSMSREVIRAKDLDTIYANCDFISLHAPLNDETRGSINDETIAKMKDGVRILNLSRGELVDDTSMAGALESGKVACYVTDFPNAATLSMKNAVCIPHLGASTPESEENCAEMAVRQVADYLENGNIKNSVNLPDLELPRSGQSRVCVIHDNKPSMINIITGAIGGAGLNINKMANNSKKELGYTVIDVDSAMCGKVVADIASMPGILRVRAII